MSALVIPYQHPIITAYQKAFEAHFDLPAPRVSRRSTKGYVIHGSTGDSRVITEAQMQRITKALQGWVRERA